MITKIKKLVNNHHFYQALKLIDEFDADNNEFYEMLVLKSKSLIGLKEYKRALSFLDEELSMPYIPKKYEKIFKSLRLDVISKMPKNSKISLLSKDDLEKILFTEGEEKIIATVNNLKQLNISPFLDIINKYLMWKNANGKIQSILIYLLKEANISKDLKIFKKNKILVFNPLQVKEVFKIEGFSKGQVIIEEAFKQHVSKEQLAKQIYFTSVFETVPLKIEKKEIIDLALKSVKKTNKAFQ